MNLQVQKKRGISWLSDLALEAKDIGCGARGKEVENYFLQGHGYKI
jgi:hypothetical protein